jgi:hypothetical protein
MAAIQKEIPVDENRFRVKIKSTAVNHLDLVEASGTARQILPIDLPWIPGHVAECKEKKIWPNEFMNYSCVTFRKFLERVTLRSAAPPSGNSTRMTVCYMSPQVPSLGTMPSINLQVI